jgi:hypothetical protein
VSVSVSVLVPYAPAGPERARAWGWVERRWRESFPDAELVVAAPAVVGDPGRFCRAAALNRAAERAGGDVFVLADADTAFSPSAVRAALARLATEAWVLPERYVRLNSTLSATWLTRPSGSPPPPAWEAGVEEEWPANVSGIVALPREAFDVVGGFDERFRGWGWEDGSFACALSTLWGPLFREPGHVAWHLWHPRPPEHSVWGPFAGVQRRLGERYLAAAGDPLAMAALLAERAEASCSG